MRRSLAGPFIFFSKPYISSRVFLLFTYLSPVITFVFVSFDLIHFLTWQRRDLEVNHAFIINIKLNRIYEIIFHIRLISLRIWTSYYMSLIFYVLLYCIFVVTFMDLLFVHLRFSEESELKIKKKKLSFLSISRLTNIYKDLWFLLIIIHLNSYWFFWIWWESRRRRVGEKDRPKKIWACNTVTVTSRKTCIFLFENQFFLFVLFSSSLIFHLRLQSY